MTPSELVARLESLVAAIPGQRYAAVLRAVEQFLPARPTAAPRPASVERSAPPPWSPEDLVWAASSAGWPPVTLPDGRRLDGEDDWRAALDGAETALVGYLHRALSGDADDPEEDVQDDVIDGLTDTRDDHTDPLTGGADAGAAA
jgi:hypothetical protein